MWVKLISFDILIHIYDKTTEPVLFTNHKTHKISKLTFLQRFYPINPTGFEPKADVKDGINKKQYIFTGNHIFIIIGKAKSLFFLPEFYSAQAFIFWQPIIEAE